MPKPTVAGMLLSIMCHTGPQLLVLAQDSARVVALTFVSESRFGEVEAQMLAGPGKQNPSDPCVCAGQRDFLRTSG